MARRSVVASFLAAALTAALLPLGVSAADPPALPGSMAAVGDSISQAASTGGVLGTDYPANAWSTGTNTTVNSHYLRLRALNPAITGHAYNDSVSGGRMADLDGQMRTVITQDPDYLTVLMGGNDLCTDTVAQMPSAADFAAQFTTAMNTLKAGSPNTRVQVVSIPRVTQLWELFKSSFSARVTWSLGGICQSLLANPTSTQAADVQRRAQVAQRNIDYNAALAQVCAQYGPMCRFDGNAVYNVLFAKSDVSGDYFHPSIAGQTKLAAVAWTAGFWPNGGPAPDALPTAAFTASCVNLDCTFNASASTDDHGITAYGWTFGDGASGTGVAASHAFAAAGTYTVTLVVTDTAGQTATLAKPVTVSAAVDTIHLTSAIGSAASRKGGWTATVAVTVGAGSGAPVGGATVAGTWSTGETGTCVTSAGGACSFSLNVSRKVATVTWTVSSIAAPGHSYNASGNLVSASTISAP